MASGRENRRLMVISEVLAGLWGFYYCLVYKENKIPADIMTGEVGKTSFEAVFQMWCFSFSFLLLKYCVFQYIFKIYETEDSWPILDLFMTYSE